MLNARDVYALLIEYDAADPGAIHSHVLGFAPVHNSDVHGLSDFMWLLLRGRNDPSASLR
jgi:hypothetical protein